jgi:hypothetical protein
MSLVLSGPRITFQLLSASDVQFGQDMRTALPDEAYLLTADRHNNPLLMFADRKVLMSYSGWYVNYGSDWPKTWADRTAMLSGATNARDLIAQYGVTHAAFTDEDIAGGAVSQAFFDENYELWRRQANWWVYKLK